MGCFFWWCRFIDWTWYHQRCRLAAMFCLVHPSLGRQAVGRLLPLLLHCWCLGSIFATDLLHFKHMKLQQKRRWRRLLGLSLVVISILQFLWLCPLSAARGGIATDAEATFSWFLQALRGQDAGLGYPRAKLRIERVEQLTACNIKGGETLWRICRIADYKIAWGLRPCASGWFHCSNAFHQ